MIFDFFKSWNKSSKKIRKRIQYKDLVIVLYDYKHQDPIEKESNICAFGLENNFLWTAQNCDSGRYFDMQIDETNNTLEAENGGGMFYDIELTKGKIIREMLRK